MNVSSRLDSLRLQNATIDAVVYVDFKATTVLGASSHAARPQEVLDGLCRVASEAFSNVGNNAEQAVLATVTELLVLQNVPQEAGTALCFFFPPETPSQQARGIARRTVEILDL
ncbi:hypothetical protein [Tropicimonas marinistellae]|uniref:hypothetical protein n=1 Tax=Tropicimonas marinistellae TaxID=1739787 RepID=UPI00122E6AF5|nr:hypothetical protein [Tropicimonas marinistellae]